MFYIMLNDCFQHKQCTLKCMYEHLNWLKKIPGLYPRAQIQQGREREWGKGRVERRRGEEKVEGMMEGRGGRKAWGIRMGGGIAPLLLGGIDATGHPACKQNWVLVCWW